MPKLSEMTSEGRYLKAEDLLDKDTGRHKEASVQIDAMWLTEKKKFNSEDIEDSVEISFVGRDKVMGLNVTNRRTLMKDFDIDPDLDHIDPDNRIDGDDVRFTPPLDVVLFVVPVTIKDEDGNTKNKFGLRLRKDTPPDSSVPF